VSIAARCAARAWLARRGIGHELDPDPKSARRARCIERLVDLGARRRQIAAREKVLLQRAGGGVTPVEDVGELREEPQASIQFVVEIQIEERVTAAILSVRS
jgi:hypothetical protein